MQKISQIEGLIQDTKGLKSFEFFNLNSLAIPKLKLAKDGLQYIKYKYICCYIAKIQKHCKDTHK
jgi:hypothetical protein